MLLLHHQRNKMLWCGLTCLLSTACNSLSTCAALPAERAIQNGIAMIIVGVNVLSGTMRALKQQKKRTYSLQQTGAQLCRVLFTIANLCMQGAAVLSEAVSTHASLRLLDLSDCGLTAYGVHAISEALAQNQSLHTLMLEDCQTQNPPQEQSTRAIARMLEANSTLKHLYLGKHSLRDSDLQLLVDYGLANNSTLELLDLRANRLSGMCRSSLARLLAEASSITSINLSCNRIGDEGCSALAEGLQSSSVEELDVRSCNISDTGLARLAQALLHVPAMRKVWIWDNAFGSEASAAWQKLSEKRSGEQHLELDIEMYSVDGKAMVAKAA